MIQQEVAPLLLIGALGYGAYAHHSAIGNIEAAQRSKVIEKQTTHIINSTAISEISKVLSAEITSKCSNAVKSCLDNIVSPESCRNSSIPLITLHNLYGQKGVNENFSIEATSCYLEVDGAILNCKSQQLACLESHAPINKAPLE